MRKHRGDDEEREERGKRPTDMTLIELRAFLKDQAQRLEQDALMDNNAEWVRKWLLMPIAEFEEKWNEIKQKNISPLIARRDFYRLAGAYKPQGGNYDDAIVVPEGFRGPIMADVVEWRFHELGLISYAKQKDAERSAAAAGVDQLAEKMKAPGSDVPF